MSLDTLDDVDISSLMKPYAEPNDGDHFTHIVNPPNNLHIWQLGKTS